MNMTPIIDRLVAQVAVLKSVEGAAALADAMADGPRYLPSAFVIEETEKPGENELVQAVHQEVVVTFLVVYVLGNVRDTRGDAASDDLEPLRNPTIAALLGWMPAGAETAIEYGGGELVDLDANKNLWWQDRFKTTYSLRSV